MFPAALEEKCKDLFDNGAPSRAAQLSDTLKFCERPGKAPGLTTSPFVLNNRIPYAHDHDRE
jgi:hypothetical protein